MRLRPGLLTAIAVLCIAAAAGQAQYVEDSVDVGGAWVGSLAYNPEQDEIWGASWSGNRVFAISCSRNTVVASIPMSSPGDLVWNSTFGKLYCAYYGPGQESLAVISVASRQVIKRLEMPGSTTPVWDAVSDRVYVSCQTTGRVAVVDCATDSLLKCIPVGACPMKMYINTLRRKLYVLNYDDGTVSIVDMATNQVTKTVDVGGTPNAGYYCRSADKFYCSSPSGIGRVTVIDGRGDTVLARIPLPAHGEALSMAGDERTATVVLGVHSSVGNHGYFVHAPNDSVTSVLPVGREPWGMLFNSNSGLFYSANAISDNVSVMTGDGSRVTGTLPVGDAPFVLVAVPRHQRIYVGHNNCSKVFVIRDTFERSPEGQPSKPDSAAGFALGPNPFRDRLSMVCGMTVIAKEVMVFGEDGRLVRVLNVTKSASGVLRMSWDGKDSRGRSVRAGVYFCTLDNGAKRISRKIVLTE